MVLIANKYKVIQKLGQGTFGVVVLAEHLDLGIPYAIKILKKIELDAKGEGNDHMQNFLNRFKREAAILMSFVHPYSVQLRDFGRTEDGHYYMAMDYCSGASLSEVLIKEGPLPIERVLNITIQLLDVLEAAHGDGIIHRDIKPGNIMITCNKKGEEEVKVLDFGIAKLHASLGESEEVGDLTQPGSMLGTPPYMSPEQITGCGIDARADIYSLGIVMYEMIAGVVPFRGTNIGNLLKLHLTAAPPSFDQIASRIIPPHMENTIMKALGKRKEERFQSAREFQEACLKSLERLKATALEQTLGDYTPLPSTIQKASFVKDNNKEAPITKDNRDYQEKPVIKKSEISIHNQRSDQRPFSEVPAPLPTDKEKMGVEKVAPEKNQPIKSSSSGRLQPVKSSSSGRLRPIKSSSSGRLQPIKSSFLGKAKGPTDYSRPSPKAYSPFILIGGGILLLVMFSMIIFYFVRETPRGNSASPVKKKPSVTSRDKGAGTRKILFLHQETKKKIKNLFDKNQHREGLALVEKKLKEFPSEPYLLSCKKVFLARLDRPKKIQSEALLLKIQQGEKLVRDEGDERGLVLFEEVLSNTDRKDFIASIIAVCQKALEKEMKNERFGKALPYIQFLKKHHLFLKNGLSIQLKQFEDRSRKEFSHLAQNYQKRLKIFMEFTRSIQERILTAKKFSDEWNRLQKESRKYETLYYQASEEGAERLRKKYRSKLRLLRLIKESPLFETERERLKKTEDTLKEIYEESLRLLEKNDGE